MLEESRYALIKLESCQKSSFFNKASKMLRQLDCYYETIRNEELEFKPCILRSESFMAWI
jgi:hypothetical protein